jgi:hypothetical protein
MLSSFLLFVVACTTDIACVPCIDGSHAVAGVPLAPYVLAIVGLHTIAGIPGVVDVPAVAFIPVVAGVLVAGIPAFAGAIVFASIPADPGIHTDSI